MTYHINQSNKNAEYVEKLIKNLDSAPRAEYLMFLKIASKTKTADALYLKYKIENETYVEALLYYKSKDEVVQQKFNEQLSK